MPPLRPVLDSRVEAHEIDHLGHLNVRRYSERAEAAIPAQLAAVGLDASSLAALQAVPAVTGMFMRNYREQLLGAPLTLLGGVLGATAGDVVLYSELHNTDTGELSATFVQHVGLFARATRAPLTVPPAVVTRAQAEAVDLPAEGKPRSLSLDPIPVRTRAELQQHGVVDRPLRTISAGECDELGFAVVGPAMLAWGPHHSTALGEDDDDGDHPLLHRSAGGGRVGFATVETQRRALATVRVGERVQTLSATIAMAAKTRIRREWTFNLETGAMLAAGDFFDLAFDRDARRVVEIPAGLRRELEQEFRPELG